METLRDTAFGKLVRVFSRQRWMKYPEEQDPSVWTEYLKTETETKGEEESPTPVERFEDLEAFGLYTVTSQASTRTRRTSYASTLRGTPQPLVISWRGQEDSEVGIFFFTFHHACSQLLQMKMKS